MLLGFFSNKLDFKGLKKSNIFWLASSVVELKLIRPLVAMPSKLGYTLTLFINVKNWISSLFTSGLFHNFIQVKVKEVCFTKWTLHLQKFILLTLK